MGGNGLFSLALLRRWQDLCLWRQADPHEVGVGQAPSLAEELNMVLMDVGAIPRARQRHGSKTMWRRGGAETGGCGGNERKKGGREGAERERVCEPLSLPLPPTYRLAWRSRGGAAWGNVGIDRAHSPTSRDYCALTAK